MTTPWSPTDEGDTAARDPAASPHDVEAVLGDLSAGLAHALGPALVGLWVHGSFVAGDFEPTRSDLDVLALLDASPGEATLAAVAQVHEFVDGRHPGWRGRVEVETVGLPTVAFLAAGAQSYAVLSLCRARCALVDGEQLSKRGAADRVAAQDADQRRDDAELVRWARDWWYAGGADTDTHRFEPVRDFVVRTSHHLLETDPAAT